MEQVLDVFVKFFADAKLPIILVLIGLDVLTGVAEALKLRVFDWEKLSDFYRTKVIPYVVGYLALYTAISFVTDIEALLGAGLVSVAWGALVLSLVSSILDHFKAIGVQK